MLNKKYCEPYMIAAFIIIVILGVLYTGTAKINLQYVRGVEISRADILIRSELLMLRTSIMYIVLLLVFTRTIRNDLMVRMPTTSALPTSVQLPSANM